MSIMDCGLAGAHDRTKVSDRNAKYILAATAKSLGHDLKDIVCNRISINRERSKFRNICIRPNGGVKPRRVVPLIIHWGGKMLCDIMGKEVVDRLPILVSGVGIQQLLAVPKIYTGTGDNMASAITTTIVDWKVTDQVKGMCFHTSSNTGYRNGACILIEQKLDKDLLHIAYRHHIYELVLKLC